MKVVHMLEPLPLVRYSVSTRMLRLLFMKRTIMCHSFLVGLPPT